MDPKEKQDSSVSEEINLDADVPEIDNSTNMSDEDVIEEVAFDLCEEEDVDSNMSENDEVGPDTSEDDLMKRLCGIGSIQPGHKYSVQHRTSAPASSWWTSGSRTWYRESRTETLKELKEVLELAKYKPIRSNLVEPIAKAIQGIRELCKTYKDWPEFIKELKEVKQEYKKFLRALNIIYDELEKSSHRNRRSGKKPLIKAEPIDEDPDIMLDDLPIELKPRHRCKGFWSRLLQKLSCVSQKND